MAGIRQIITGLGLVILFSFCLFIFMIEFITVNNPDPIAANDPYINQTFADLQEQARELETIGNNSKAILAADQPSAIYLFLIIKSAFTIPLSFLSFLVNGVGIISGLFFTLLFGNGSSPFHVVLGVVNSIILITIVFAIIRAIRSGETER